MSSLPIPLVHPPDVSVSLNAEDWRIIYRLLHDSEIPWDGDNDKLDLDCKILRIMDAIGHNGVYAVHWGVNPCP